VTCSGQNIGKPQNKRVSAYKSLSDGPHKANRRARY